MFIPEGAVVGRGVDGQQITVMIKQMLKGLKHKEKALLWLIFL